MIRTVPITTWPGKATPPGQRQPNRYEASPGKNRRELLRELELIGARDVYLQAAYREDQIRLDGMPKAGAAPAHPGVILTYVGKDGSTYQLPCDTFRDAEQNLRAIVLTLQRLRLIDETGVKTHGAQYTGFKALPPPSAPQQCGPFANVEDAAAFLHQVSGALFPAADLLRWERLVSQAYRAAAKTLHPDTPTGDAAKFNRLQVAVSLLRDHHQGTSR